MFGDVSGPKNPKPLKFEKFRGNYFLPDLEIVSIGKEPAVVFFGQFGGIPESYNVDELGIQGDAKKAFQPGLGAGDPRNERILPREINIIEFLQN